MAPDLVDALFASMVSHRPMKLQGIFKVGSPKAQKYCDRFYMFDTEHPI